MIIDFEGNYFLFVFGNGEIVFLYIGYCLEILKFDGKDVLNVIMQEDIQQIGEVVVIVLGIKCEKKMLGYVVQELKSDELNKIGDFLVISVLQGKVVGFQMNILVIGLGGFMKIIICGNFFFIDNNQLLWIVDGVFFSDISILSVFCYDGVDCGSVFMDINLDDIESIFVLKGLNVVVFYGLCVGNGVILIMIKKGSKKDGFGICYSGNFIWIVIGEILDM